MSYDSKHSLESSGVLQPHIDIDLEEDSTATLTITVWHTMDDHMLQYHWPEGGEEGREE